MNVENELDIRGLFRALWAGKGWIVGGAVLFAAIVLVYTFFARQEWSATAITDRPTVNMLGVLFPAAVLTQSGYQSRPGLGGSAFRHG